MPGKTQLPGLRPVADRIHRCRGRAVFHCSERRRSGTDAVGQDLLLLELRHGRRPLWRIVDDLRGALTSPGSTALAGKDAERRIGNGSPLVRIASEINEGEAECAKPVRLWVMGHEPAAPETTWNNISLSEVCSSMSGSAVS